MTAFNSILDELRKAQVFFDQLRKPGCMRVADGGYDLGQGIHQAREFRFRDDP